MLGLVEFGELVAKELGCEEGGGGCCWRERVGGDDGVGAGDHFLHQLQILLLVPLVDHTTKQQVVIKQPQIILRPYRTYSLNKVLINHPIAHRSKRLLRCDHVHVVDQHS